MDVKPGRNIVHGVFCALAGLLFLSLLVLAVAGVLWTGHDHGELFAPLILLLGTGLLFQIVLGVWVGIDANRRGMNGFLWGALTAFTCIVGLIVYLLSAQSREANGAPVGGRDVCSQCGSAARADFLICPYCGNSLRRTCPGCGRPVEGGWKYCSRCKADLGEARSPAGS